MRRVILSVFALFLVVCSVGIGRAVSNAAAQDDPGAMATHPIVGAWLVSAGGGGGVFVAGADGTVIQGFAPNAVGATGVEFSSAGLGVWEPTGENSIAFTAVSTTTDAAGTLLGTMTIDGHLTVSDDGQLWTETWDGSSITIRGPSGEIVTVIGDPSFEPFTAVRIGVGAPGFPEVEATPTS